MVQTHLALAKDYRVAANGPAAADAVSQFKDDLVSRAPELEIQFVPGIGKSSELVDFLNQGLIDIAIIPFGAIPELVRSPLLEPFYSKDAAGVRQAIDSQVGAFEKTDLEREDLRVLDFWHVSSSIFGSKTNVKKVSDLQGLKVAAANTGQNSEIFKALGATPIAIPSSEIFTAMERGALDSSVIPLRPSDPSFGIHRTVTNYVDRLYKPDLYAVVISKDRWDKIPYEDQYALARAAVAIGEKLTKDLDVQAVAFKQNEITRGARFAEWTPEDVSQILVASLGTELKSPIDQALIQLAYASAAADPNAEPDDGAESRPQANVEILFATDRALIDHTKPDTAFSSSRNLNGLSFGRAAIKLSANRKYGDDLEKTTKITKLTPLNDTEFSQSLPGDQQVVLFIHGYNNAYADVVRRGATIKADISPNATVISYTWPSVGEVLSYGYDEVSTRIADQNFTTLMEKLLESVPAERINIVAHSMGSRLVLNYISDLPKRSIYPETRKFQNFVFAASDVAQLHFKQKESEPAYPPHNVSAYANQVTVYSSQHDRPLGLSKKLHGGRPLGLAEPATMFLAAGITAVDASAIDPARFLQRFSFATRHSYVFDKAAGVRDLSLLLAGKSVESRPGMTLKKRDTEEYWQLTP